MTLLGLFGRERRRDTGAVARIKGWVVDATGSDPEPVVVVNEIACNDPACPGIETVILIMIPGQKTRACKIQMPLEEVGADDVKLAIGPLPDTETPPKKQGNFS